MKNFFKAHFAPVIGVIALVAIIGFSMAACGDGGGGSTDSGPRTVTYSGTGSGNTYELKIIENKNITRRAVLTDPLPGDNFEFTMTDSSNVKKTSSGTVISKSSDEFTMLPYNAATPQTTFTTTVSDAGLTAMSGTFTWTDGTTGTGTGTLTPSGGPGSVTPPVTGGGGQAPSGPSVNAALEGSGVVWTMDVYPDGYYIFIGGKLYAGAYYSGKYLADTKAIGTYTNTTVYLSEENSEYTYSVSGNKLTWTVTNGGNSVQIKFTKKTVTLTWGGDPGTGGGGGGGGNSIATNGQITISCIPAKHNGKYAYAIGGGYTSSYSILMFGAGQSIDHGFVTGAKIVNGSVTLKVWKTNITLTTHEGYNGNDKDISFDVYVSLSGETYSDDEEEIGEVKVDFSNGKANGTLIDNSTVTIGTNGLPYGGTSVNPALEENGVVWVERNDSGYVFYGSRIYPANKESGVWIVNASYPSGAYNTTTIISSGSYTYSIQGNTLTYTSTVLSSLRFTYNKQTGQTIRWVFQTDD